MNWFEHPALEPAVHLAWEEAALDAVEAGDSGPLLWFWESGRPFVVVGYGQEHARECDLGACAREGIPVLRRCSGGGAVAQGPGCLNYGVALPIDPDGPTGSITGANDWVMERQRRSLEGALGTPVTRRGDTDLVAGERKFSGNAQRRKRRALLFHGTLLLGFDLPALARWLRFPSSTPGYRAGRSHLDFVRNLGVGAGPVRDALVREWGATAGEVPGLGTRAAALMPGRYGDPGWHARR